MTRAAGGCRIDAAETPAVSLVQAVGHDQPVGLVHRNDGTLSSGEVRADAFGRVPNVDGAEAVLPGIHERRGGPRTLGFLAFALSLRLSCDALGFRDACGELCAARSSSSTTWDTREVSWPALLTHPWRVHQRVPATAVGCDISWELSWS